MQTTKLLGAMLAVALCLSAAEPEPAGTVITETEQLKRMFLELQRQVADQQHQIDQLRHELAVRDSFGPKPSLGEVAVVAPAVPVTPVPEPQAAVATSAPTISDATKAQLDALGRNLGGFKFSGDLRFRFDLLDRAANTSLPSGDNRSTPQQRARERYRVRFNIDKDLFAKDGQDKPLAHFHLQLATDPYNNPITMDTDFAGIATRAPFSISEAYMDFNPLKGLTLRAGRTTELFADNRQFVYDDDIRFNGFHQTYRWTGKKGLYVQFGAAQYILTDPNVQSVPTGSGFLAAGYKVGQRIPSSNLFDQGVTVGGNINKKWSTNFTVNYFAVREPNQIQLASTANGAALFQNNPIVGSTLTSVLGGSGNATTTAGGGTYYASAFHVVRQAFNLNYTGGTWRGHAFPFALFLQGTQNTGASIDQKGYMLGASLGQTAKRGDVQFQYQYFYKPANAFIAQFSDDDVGTGSGVNVKTNQLRVNFGITRFLAWENRLYIQKGISVNNPAINYFLPLQQGYNTQFRLHSQFVFTF